MSFKSIIFSLFTLSLLFLVAGCADSTVGPSVQDPEAVTTTGSDADQFAASKVSRTESYQVFSIEGATPYIDCLGETWILHGYTDFWLVMQEMPSGNVSYHAKLNYDTDEPFWAESPSGPWVIMNGEDISHTVVKPKGTEVIDHWQANETYVNPDGGRIHQRLSWNYVRQADGTVKVLRFVQEFTCNF